METAVLARNLKALIAATGGTVNSTADAVEIPQKSLSRMVAGTSPRPNLTYLQKLADHFKADLDWLTRGRGAAPAILDEPLMAVMRRSFAGRLGWQTAVRNLQLPEPIATALLVAPEAPITALSELQPLRPAEPLDGDADARDDERRARVSEMSYTLWAMLLRDLVAQYGVEAIAKRVTEHVEDARFGFAPFAMFLLREKAIVPRRDRWFADFSSRSWRIRDAFGGYPDWQDTDGGNAYVDRIAWSPPPTPNAPDPQQGPRVSGLKRLSPLREKKENP